MNIGAKLYRPVRWAVNCVYPKIRLEGTGNIPRGPVIFVGNHCQVHGPIAAELYIPGRHDTWCAGEMMSLKEVPDYAFQDFWREKPRCSRWFYRILSYLMAPLCVLVFRNAHTVAVYRDSRSLSTLKETVKRMEQGTSMVIFPEGRREHNPIVNEFQSGFVDAARLYSRRTGRDGIFVPMYLSPQLRTLTFGTPVKYCHENPPAEERSRVCRELMQAITDMAQAMPRHRVVPYRNMPKSQYPYSRDREESDEAHCS